MVAVPDRLEEAVGEPQGEDVLHRLLAEEVVDPEDLLLVEDVVDASRRAPAPSEVGAERLLDDDARASASPVAPSVADDAREAPGGTAR